VSKAPHYNSTFRYLENATLEPILKSLVTLTALPLKACETKFAVDASGFSTCRFVRWFNKKYGHEQDNRMWVKAHMMTGCNTNVITSVEITDWLAYDGPLMPKLVEDTAKNFAVETVAADKAYSSQRNLQVVSDIGATPYIPFKNNATGESGGLWAKCFHYFNLHRDEFLTHYHVRSNAESTFSMLKRTLGDSLRSKTDAALKNELLCNVIAHNIRCLVQAMYELGINPTFGAEVQPALKVVSLLHLLTKKTPDQTPDPSADL
jgi:transposase